MQSIYSTDAPPPAGPYAHAARTGPLLALSGQIGIIPETGVLARGFSAQAEQVFTNLGRVLDAAGASWTDVAKIQVFITNWGNFEELNTIYTRLVTTPIAEATGDPQRLPARTTVGGTLIGDVLIEADVLAWIGGATA